MLISQIYENLITLVLCSTISLSPYRSQSLYLHCSEFDVDEQDVFAGTFGELCQQKLTCMRADFVTLVAEHTYFWDIAPFRLFRSN